MINSFKHHMVIHRWTKPSDASGEILFIKPQTKYTSDSSHTSTEISFAFFFTNRTFTQVFTCLPRRVCCSFTRYPFLSQVLGNHYLPNQILYSEWTPLQYQVNFYTGFPTDPSNVNPTLLIRSAIRRLVDGSGKLWKNQLFYLSGKFWWPDIMVDRWL